MRVTIVSAVAVGLALACAGCSGKATSSAAAAGGEAAGEAVLAIACPAQPKPDCVTIASGGKTYDITDAKVDLSKHVVVSVTGTAKGEMGACGPKLTDVKVDYQTLTCGAAPAP